MLSSKIVCSDAFTDMPFSAQALYVQLNMEADDDGFLNRAKRIVGSIGATADDLDLLIQKRYVLAFPNGVVVIKHWRMNNQIRKDRYTPTQYQDEFNMLEIKDDGAYTERAKEEAVDSLATTWQPNDNQDGDSLATQYRLGKDSVGKCSIDKDIGGISPETPPTPPKPKKKEEKPVFKKYGENGWVQLTDEQYNRLIADLGETETKRCITHIDESAQITGNKNKWKDWNLVVRRCNREGWGLKTTQGYAEKKSKYSKPTMDYTGDTETDAIRRLLDEKDFEAEAEAFRKRLEEIGCG